jgi:hypothetical protein
MERINAAMIADDPRMARKRARSPTCFWSTAIRSRTSS